MAIRGVKPKPAYIKLVTGNPGHRPIVEDPATGADPAYDNGLEPPRRLTRRQQEFWDTYIRKAQWLTPFDVPRAFMWVHLHTEFERAPGKMIAGKIAQLRALGSELGLDPASRTRLATDTGQRAKDPAEAFFD